jgi:hypothetical protein
MMAFLNRMLRRILRPMKMEWQEAEERFIL